MWGEQLKQQSAKDPRISGFNELLQDLEDDRNEPTLPASIALDKHISSGKDLEIDLQRGRPDKKRVTPALTVELDTPPPLESEDKLRNVNRQKTDNSGPGEQPTAK